jgi:hypothetical protein
MASLSVLKDATIPLDTSNWTQVNKKMSKKTSSNPAVEIDQSKYVKTKISITLRVPNDKQADYSAAEVHIATLRELSKQDNNLIVLDHSGNKHVNIHKSFGHEMYKEMFQPREKAFTTGGGQVSVAHYVLSEISSFNKTIMIPFLRSNKVFIYFNQKEGLEHFSAIGVIFGPHPDYTWRQDICESLETTMRADLTPEEREILTKNTKNPKLVIQLTPQTISNKKFTQITTVALEVRVPAELERTYLEILDRLNERASLLQDGEVDIVLDDRIGTFFPFYAKAERPKLFERLMRKQNADMQATSVLPIFGYTAEAMESKVKNHLGGETTLHAAIRSHPNIKKIIRTASSSDVGKYLLLIDRYLKDDVEIFLDGLFDQLPDMTEYPANFKKPQRGGNAFKKARINKISNYLDKLENSINDSDMLYLDDDETSTPPKRPKRFTISYAQATKRLSFQQETILTPPTKIPINSTTVTTTTSSITQESLEESLRRFRIETDNSIAGFRQEIQEKFTNIEDLIVSAVTKAIKTPAQEIHTQANLNDNNSNYSTAQESTNTTSTLTDKVDNLTEIVLMLTKDLKELRAEREREREPPKRTRSPLPTPPKNRTSREDNDDDEEKSGKSPPSKLSRPRSETQTMKPPRHPMQQLTAGAMEES